MHSKTFWSQNIARLENVTICDIYLNFDYNKIKFLIQTNRRINNRKSLDAVSINLKISGDGNYLTFYFVLSQVLQAKQRQLQVKY